MKLKAIFIFFIVISSNSFSQNVFNGLIVDSNTGLGIKNSTVSIYATKESTTTDSTGTFVLSSRKKKPEVTVVHASYITGTFKLTKKNDFYLPLDISEIVIGHLDINPSKIINTIESNPCRNIEEKEWLRDSVLLSSDLVSVNAWYPGGHTCFLNELANTVYPYIVSKVIKPFGSLKISFTVDAAGRPSNLFVDKEVTKELLIILNDFFINSKTWVPATQLNECVPSYYKVYLHY